MDNATAQVDNSTAQATETVQATEAAVTATATTETAAAATVTAEKTSTTTTGGWKGTIRPDLRESPFVQKFDDTPKGLEQALESYGNLEKLMGHGRVAIPKDANDVEGWSRYSKAMGIPDKAEGYGLPDANIPDSMKGMTMDKNKFAEVMHAHKVHPSAVKGIWETYQQMNIDTYKQAMDKHNADLNKTVNTLKGEWGDTYAVNVELGQMVINKFSLDQEMNDYLTTVLTQDPRGIKFLAKIGDQFAENKVGEFQMKRFSMTPDECIAEANKMRQDMEGPYMNSKNKFSDAEHDASVSRVNMLLETARRAKG